MLTKSFYTLSKVAAILGLTEDEVQKLITDGHLKGTFMDNIGSYIVTQDDMIRYLKSRKDWKRIQKIMPSRVVLCDRDSNFQSLVSAELRRFGVEYKIATEPGDLVRAFTEFAPDVVVVPLFALLRTMDSLGDVIKRARSERPCRLIVYYDSPSQLTKDPTTQEKLQALEPDESLALQGRVSLVVDAIRNLIGLR